MIIFNSPVLPNIVYESLSQYKVIVLGEFHTILEEREFVGSLAVRLNEKKEYTEVCAECPDAYSWIFQKLSTGELENLPEGISYKKVMPILNSLKKFNSGDNKSAKPNCIDANLQPHFFLNSLKTFAEYFSDSADLFFIYDSFLNSSPLTYKENLIYYIDILANSPSNLGLSASNANTIQLLRMFQNELISVDIRTKWNTDYLWSINKRETLIKSSAEYFISRNEGTTIFYFGLNHAQKKRFMGSKIEWLGEYLHNQSVTASGKTISIVGVPLKGEITNGNVQGTIHFNLVQQSKSNDLFRLVGEQTNYNYSWLFLTDNLFLENNIRTKYIYNEISVPIGEQYDAFFIFPVGTYVGW